ncbi:hypothetical protein JW868_02905 [Candidatus Woesearchaeota archaeon]|nr:hypothetical protein [Candidatus Woesearchaeota archaeon]
MARKIHRNMEGLRFGHRSRKGAFHFYTPIAWIGWVVIVIAGLLWYSKSGEIHANSIESHFGNHDAFKIMHYSLQERSDVYGGKTLARLISEAGSYEDPIANNQLFRGIANEINYSLSRYLPERNDYVWFSSCIYGTKGIRPSNPVLYTNLQMNDDLRFLTGYYKHYPPIGGLFEVQPDLPGGPCQHAYFDDFPEEICTEYVLNNFVYDDKKVYMNKYPDKINMGSYVNAIVVPNKHYGNLVIYMCVGSQ